MSTITQLIRVLEDSEIGKILMKNQMKKLQSDYEEEIISDASEGEDEMQATNSDGKSRSCS